MKRLCVIMKPRQGGNTIRQLLKIAKKTVPQEEWSRTPVVLKATAGLRLLPEDKASALLKEVRCIFSLPRDSLAQTLPSPPKSEARNGLQVSMKKQQLGPCGGYHFAKESQLLWGCVEQLFLSFERLIPVCSSSHDCG